MDMRRLEIFCEVFQLGSYSKAAKKLGLTQSAVSQQVRALESELRAGLFDEGNRTAPTAAGDYLYRNGMRLLASVRDVENGILHASGFGGGAIRFGMIDVAATELMPRVLGKFKKKYPQVVIHADVKTSGELMEMVEEGVLDFAVAITDCVPDAMKGKTIFSDSIVAVVQKNSRFDRKTLNVKDLRGEPLILYPSSSHSRMLIERIFRSKGVVPTVSMEMHYPAAICAMVKQGMGIALLSLLSARDAILGSQSIVPIEELTDKRHIGVITAKGRSPSPQARELISYIESV